MSTVKQESADSRPISCVAVVIKAHSMPLARERRLEILSQLEEKGSVRVTALAESFGVAEETIRRDLDRLSHEGQLARTHGGALSIRSDRFDLPLAVRRNSRAREKRSIAQQALSHIQPNDVIALDASTTVLELACLLPDEPLTVITYSLDAARVLIDRPQIQVVCVGGELDAKSVCLLGPVAEANLRQFSISKVFFSCKGVDLERGYSEAATTHASIKSLLLQLAERSYLMADHSKFGVRSMAYFGGLSDANVVITDEQAGAEALSAFKNAGVEVHIAQGRTSTHPR